MDASVSIVASRVAGLLEAAWRYPLTVICAEAGFGKSAALAAVVARDDAALVTLRPEHADAARLAADVAAAVGIGPRGDRPQAAELGRALAGVAAEFLLALDQVEHLVSSKGAAGLLAEMIHNAPENLHVVLAGRQLPALGLERAAAEGRLHRLMATDLAFTASESAVVLADRPAEVVARCQQLSAGWPAAVYLAGHAFSHADRATEMPAERVERALRTAWRPFAEAVLAGQPLRRALGIAVVVGSAEPSLLAAIGVPVSDPEWTALEERGLLISAGAGRLIVAPVLAEVARAAIDATTAASLLASAGRWWEQGGRLGEALECYAAGEPDALRAFLVRCGYRLTADGASGRIAELAARCRPSGPDLDAVAADAWWVTGDWETALATFERVVDAYGEEGLPASAAWRLGALLYLRDERGRAETILAAARADDGVSADDALVSAWLGSAVWRSGRTEAATALADLALRQARVCQDPRARAAAEVTRALVCASRGDRYGNMRSYRVALRLAREAQDVIQIGRIHANLASKSLEEGDYAGAVESADRAIQVAERHWPIVALALENKAEALLRQGRLEPARAAAAEAVDGYAKSGSLQGATPQLLLGEAYRLRGDRVQARLAFERALRSAELAEDAHLLAAASAGLAWVLARDDPTAAQAYAGRALGVASELERAAALNASAWAHLVAGDNGAAVEAAGQAEAAAQRTDDRAALATALEIRAATSTPPDLTMLRAAFAVWAEIGDPIAAARLSYAIAVAVGDRRAAGRARGELAVLGAASDAGVAGLLAGDDTAEGPLITTLGRFTVSVAGEPVPSGVWQSRKARELLKLLATRSPRPLTREAAADALWPREPYEAVAARLSVLLSRLRMILDPDRRHPPDHYLDTDRVGLALRVDRVRVDVVEFLDAAAEGTRLARAGLWSEAEQELRRAEQIYVGDLLEDDGDADWAVDRREQARIAAVGCARLLARGAALRADDEDAVRWLLRLLERDPYDEDAWTALIAAHIRMRRHGEARHQHAAYARRMTELDLAVEPFEKLADRLP